MMPELYLADALGATGKPIMRVHTAGSVGGSTAVVATHLIESQIHERVLTLAFEKQSEGDTNFAFSSGRSGGVGAGGYFAPHIRAYIERSGAPDYVGPMVAVKDRKNALKNPYAHLKIPDITIEIGGHEVGSAPARANRFDYFGASPLAAAAHDHMGFLGGEGDGYGPPDVAG